ncbi:MAG: glycoside hydrolase family 3 N-terminal domain-containing protein [Anaerolineae bacterium]
MRRFLTGIFLIALIAGGLTPVSAQQPTDPAVVLLSRMPPAARVGQLFIVAFPGTDTAETSAIYDLIVHERIGGVLLSPENGNITNEGDTPAQVATLTSQLQRLAWDAAQLPLSEKEATLSPYLPLFIAIRHGERTGLPTLPISGTTPLPSPMAIGATWDPANAELVGQITGAELDALGINLLLGPMLDVLDTPRPGSAADLGTASFGGDPFWVGQMGRAYIRGIHAGSEGRVGVIPGHFPGLGAADRPLSEEVSTVQKSLEQLKQIELAPFLAATGSSEATERPEGLLVVPIRYRGFLGNLYASTKPATFDPQALQSLLALPEVAPWREAGGVVVADELGVRAIRRFYDPSEQKFNPLRVAQEAFLAGNDLLILSHFATGDDWESHIANVKATLAFFREKYASDPSFQARVDEAVLRILRLKLRLYGSRFTLSATQRDADVVAQKVGHSEEIIAPIARAAVTLLSPPSPELLPDPPMPEERIVIFTDDRPTAPCAGCAPAPILSPKALADTMVRLYGPQATGQISPQRVQSFTFSELLDMLNRPPVTPAPESTPVFQPVATALERADWVIFAMLDAGDRASPSGAVRRFLSERADALRGKRVVVFAFGAPYYLDTTEIAKLSAYFGVYSPSPPFVEAAVRALFAEFPFTGASPVTIPGINYNLTQQTQPDPGQVIPVFIVTEEANGTPEPPTIYQGDTLRLRTGIIVDRNGHPVPDGTLVEFILTYPQEGLERTVQATTRDGVAEATVTLDRTGQLQISVRAEPVPRAVRLEIDIRPGEPAVIIPITPTPSPAPPPTPSPAPSPTPEIAPTPEPAALALPPDRARGTDLMQGLLVALTSAIAGYASLWKRGQSLPRALRGGLQIFTGGLTGYLLFLAFVGIGQLRLFGDVGAAILTAIGAAVPLTVLLPRRKKTL